MSVQGRFSRRRFLALAAAAAMPTLVCGDAVWLEPTWVQTRHLRLDDSHPTHRIVHFTDIHHKGDRAYLETVVAKINRLSPDFVCFTGDLIEQAPFVPEVLSFIEKIKAPVYGVPGNHDYWSRANFDLMRHSFARTGGAWMMDSQTTLPGGKIHLTGLTCIRGYPKRLAPRPRGRNLLLIHYPLQAAYVKDKFDLILSGHSHGGQVRIPFIGPLILPYWVGKYDVGMFHIPAGPLYVNPGIGWIGTPIRFNCRPELTVFDI